MKEVFENKADESNLDLDAGRTLEQCLFQTQNFVSQLPKPKLKLEAGFRIIDEGSHDFGGAKTRFAEFMMTQLEQKELVYCQPAVGLAGPSLCYLAKMFGKKLTLFMPARREATPHQLYCIEQGANVIWKRIAAMPNLQKAAREYAEQDPQNRVYIPFGLKHPLVTVGGVRAVHDMFNTAEHPHEMWTVISTGVLTRILQIALPNTEFHAVAVARNIQKGELGRAKFYSYHKAFTDKASVRPRMFDTVITYDAKGWEYMKQHASPGAWFYNVAREVNPTLLKPSDVDSYRDWD